MRVLALDIGDARIGIAAGDTATRIALPVRVLPAADVLAGARTWRDVLADEEPELLVSGLPATLRGTSGAQARHVRETAARIAEAAGLPLEFADERLSSAEAKRILREQGLSERDMRGRVDAVAASLFLETWLDRHAQAEESG